MNNFAKSLLISIDVHLTAMFGVGISIVISKSIGYETGSYTTVINILCILLAIFFLFVSIWKLYIWKNYVWGQILNGDEK